MNDVNYERPLPTTIPAKIDEVVAMGKRRDTRDVHGVSLIVPRVGRMRTSRDRIDLDGYSVTLIEVDGVVIHRLQHLLLQADTTAGSIFVGGPFRKINFFEFNFQRYG